MPNMKYHWVGETKEKIDSKGVLGLLSRISSGSTTAGDRTLVLFLLTLAVIGGILVGRLM